MQDPETSTGSRALALAGGHALVVEGARDVVRVVDGSGRVTLSIHMTPAGPVLRLEGAGLALVTSGALSIDAEQVTIRGRGGVSLVSDGDAELRATGDLTTVGRVHTVAATLGDVKITANDDVTMNGERIRMNC